MIERFPGSAVHISTAVFTSECWRRGAQAPKEEGPKGRTPQMIERCPVLQCTLAQQYSPASAGERGAGPKGRTRQMIECLPCSAVHISAAVCTSECCREGRRPQRENTAPLTIEHFQPPSKCVDKNGPSWHRRRPLEVSPHLRGFQ